MENTVWIKTFTNENRISKQHFSHNGNIRINAFGNGNRINLKMKDMTFDYKEPISQELKAYLVKYTTDDDIAAVVAKDDVEVKFHTLRRLRLAETPVVNKKNAVAITELFRRAIENAGKLKEEAGKDEKKMKNNLTQIFDCL
ncbi:hypothetical protein CMT52_08800 [Elizabethkingia anophelis]|nr:hypothetical protein [Elizabethkingia anophelis]